MREDIGRLSPRQRSSSTTITLVWNLRIRQHNQTSWVRAWVWTWVLDLSSWARAPLFQSVNLGQSKSQLVHRMTWQKMSKQIWNLHAHRQRVPWEALAFGSSLSRLGISPCGPWQVTPFADMANSTTRRLNALGMPARTTIALNARMAGVNEKENLWLLH